VDIDLRDMLTIAGFFISIIGLWYKISQDTNTKIEKVRDASGSKTDVAQLKEEVANMRANAISRQEHDRDIEKVKVEIRTFRDEVREDIRSLSTNLNTRLDLMMERIFNIHTDQKNK
jgi:hypothetical protein